MKLQLVFPLFDVEMTVNEKSLLYLIINQFPDFIKQKPQHRSAARLRVFIHYLRTSYSKLPRSKYDCFHGFTLFYNKFADHPFYKERFTFDKNPTINLDVAPRTLRTTVNFRSNTITAYIATPPDFEKHLLFDLIFFQPLKCLLQGHGLFLFHASCIANKTGGVLFSGQSGSGKTTLALALSRKKFRYICDEEVILYQGRSAIECLPFPSRPKLRRESLLLFPELRNKLVQKSLKKEKVLVKTSEEFSLSKIKPTVPRVLIFPRFVKTAPTRLEAVTKQVALARLAKEELMGIKYAPPELERQHSLFLAHLTRQVKIFRLYYKDQDLDKIPGLLIQALSR